MVTDETTRRVVGKLVPPGSFHDHVGQRRRRLTDTTDHLGRFSVDRRRPGPVRLVVADSDGTTVVTTEWVLL